MKVHVLLVVWYLYFDLTCLDVCTWSLRPAVTAIQVIGEGRSPHNIDVVDQGEGLCGSTNL
jgi:hypothetical protein